MSFKIVLLIFGIIWSVRSECLPVDRFIFELPETAGSIRKMQIDLYHVGDKWTVEVRSLRNDAKVFPGHLGCSKISENEFLCDRFDNGGGFELITQPVPELTLKSFVADQEGDEVRTFVIGPKGKAVTFTGKKALISASDLF